MPGGSFRAVRGGLHAFNGQWRMSPFPPPPWCAWWAAGSYCLKGVGNFASSSSALAVGVLRVLSMPKCPLQCQCKARTENSAGSTGPLLVFPMYATLLDAVVLGGAGDASLSLPPRTPPPYLSLLEFAHCRLGQEPGQQAGGD